MQDINKHKIVQDLLPNYIDNLTSEETNNMIEEHLNECDECKKMLETMKEDIDIKSKKTEKKEIKYAKKINKKLKLLKLLVLIIIIVILVFVGDFVRKILIIKELEKNCISFENANNMLVTKQDTIYNNDFLYSEFFCKDNNLYNRSTYCYYNKGDGYVLQKQDMYELNDGVFYNIQYDNNNEMISAQKRNYAVSSVSIQSLCPTFNNRKDFLITYAYEEKDRDFNIISMALNNKIYKQKVNGKYCYTFERKFHDDYDDGNIYTYTYSFEKSTGLLVQEIVKDNITTNYTYKMNCVSDKVFEIPDITKAQEVIINE